MRESSFSFLIILFFSLLYFSESVENNRILSECHPNCKDCTGPPNDSQHMNCISCKDGFHLYKTKNCLNCPKYINYEQTECIDTIPDGYYLANETLGILDKCHHLCKKCDGPATSFGMNCDECLYEEEGFEPTYESDCPDGIEYEYEDEDPSTPGSQCPRDEPILVRKDFCSMVYCTEEEFKTGQCKINNPIIETQWINNIERFGEGEIKNVYLDYGDNGELFLFAQQKDKNNNRWLYIYGIDQNQKPIIYDNNLERYTYFKKVNITYDIDIDNIRLVKNFENDKLFLVSTQINKEMYVIDFIENKVKVHKFSEESFSSKLSDIIYLRKLSDTYFTNFITCQENNNCYAFLRKFKFVTDDNDIQIIKKSKPDIRINQERNFICIESYTNYVQCLYTEFGGNIYMLDLFDINTFESRYKFIIEENMDNATSVIESMIKLNSESFIIVYSLKNNIIKVLIKNIDYNYNMFTLEIHDYIENVPYIKINENNSYIFEGGNPNRNSLCVLNSDKFALLLNSFNKLPEGNYDNSEIVIYIFSIFNQHKNINVRKYSINFKLYNMVNHGKILGYTFGNFFGTLIELSSPDNKNITNAGFITFGYVNTSDAYEVFDSNFFPEKSQRSNPIKIKDYLNDKLPNNLFGFDFNGVTILKTIDEEYGALLYGSNYKIKGHEVIGINNDLTLEIYHKCKPGNYSIEFAGVAGDPKYDQLDKYSEQIWSYPKNSNISEKGFFTPNSYIGKKIIYKFEIKEEHIPKICYPSCETCDEYSKEENNQKCKSCKISFYFINGTQNCFNYAKKHYYFDNTTQKYYPCYKDCFECDQKEISAQNMNCLSCTNEFMYYSQSKNCLNCPDYVNYPQTQCISSIPEGYYLANKTLGIIEPCYHLCKKCSKGPLNDTIFHMNCDKCLYENKNFVPKEQGDCPSSQDVDEEVDPIDGKCPKEKPILKNSKCSGISCSKKEFEDKTCVINNDVIKKQYFNNINIFPEDASNVKYEKGENGEIFLLAQKKEGNNINMHLYVFNKNNEGYFYDKNKNDYTPYKKITLKYGDKYIEKMKYIEFNKKGYLLNILKNNHMHLIDLESNEQYIHLLPKIPLSIDKFEKYINSNNEYFYDYTYCINETQSLFVDTCYLGLTKYQLNSKSDFKIIKSNEELIRIKPDTKLICINNIFSSKYILCKYNSFEILDEQTFINKHILGLFDNDSFELKNTFILDNFFMPEKQVLDSMLPIDENKSNFIIAYSTSQNIIKILFKTFKNDYKELKDVIEKVPYININEDLEYYLNGDEFSNDLCKIDDDNYFLLLKTYKNINVEEINNNDLLVVSIRIYQLSKVIIRYYHMDLNIYNFNVRGNLIGYNFNGFLGALLEINSNDKNMGKANFITFGFINTTKDVPVEKGTLDLIEKKMNIKINDYISEIDNNFFGYELQGIKIVNLPDNNKVGEFVNLKNDNNKIKINDTISINSELRFSPVTNPIPGNYSISFAAIVKEPSEQIAINIDDNSEYYPSNSTQYDYSLESFIGKSFTYNFAIKKEEPKCFQNCEECLYASQDINSQSCTKCKSGFYFVHNTKNCFDKLDSNFYFDKDKKEFYPCYKDCYTCNTKEINSKYMNCLSCSEPFKFYEKNKNCLNCDKYVNYDQTECIDSVPDGYYIKDKNLGILDKCYMLCKTCSRKEFEINGKLYMNCDSCIFKTNSKQDIEGNCPEKDEEEIKESESEEEKGENNALVYISVIISIIIFIAVLVVIYLKCCKKERYVKIPSGDLSIGEKNIPFDDENEDGIN